MGALKNPYMNLHVKKKVSEASYEPSDKNYFDVKLHVKLQMNFFLIMNVHVKVHLETLQNGARCSNDLASTHYQLVYAVPMVGL